MTEETLLTCKGVGVVNTVRAWTATTADIKSEGPTSHPTLHPVTPNVLPAEPTVIVRSHPLPTLAILLYLCSPK